MRLRNSNKAIAIAEKDAYNDLNNMGVLESANDQALTLVKGLLQDSIPSDYTIKVKADES